MPAVTDEIFEKYLQKAISEINELGDEIGRAAGEGRVPVLGSGHPLADVFLLKHEPQPAEVQEGVAFYGRAGQARAEVAPAPARRPDGRSTARTALKFAPARTPRRPRPWLARELHIVQPKLVVVMGEHGARVPERARVPALRPARAEARRAAAVHADDRRRCTYRTSTQSLDEQPAKTTFWNAFKTLGPWWAELPPY